MNKELNSRIFSKEYEVDNQERLRLKVMLKMVGTGNEILDLGCRDGTLAKMFTELGNSVEGVEISDYSIKKAKEKGIKVYDLNLNTNWAEKIEKRYGVVFAGEVIEHIFETDLFLQNVNKVLKDGGTFIVSTPNLASLGRRVLLLFGKNPVTETNTREGQAGHVRYFVYDTLKSALEDNGFEVVEFSSDVINFNKSGLLCSSRLARVFPAFGRSLIFKVKKVSNPRIFP